MRIKKRARELRKNKRAGAASGMFHLFVPILLFMIICFVFLMMFSLVQNNWLGEKAFKKKIKTDIEVTGDVYAGSINLNTMLNTRFNYKENKDDKTPDKEYNITLYEIFYHGLYETYDAEIKDYLESLSMAEEREATGFWDKARAYFDSTYEYAIRYYSGSSCEESTFYIDYNTDDMGRTGIQGEVDIGRVIINGKCLRVRYVPQ